MKNLFLLSVAFFALFLTSCETVPQGTLKIINEDNTSYECYFDSELLGTVEALSTVSFDVSENCGLAKVESSNFMYDTFEKEVCVTENNTSDLTVDKLPTTIEYDNWDNCSYNCYFDGKLLGTVPSYGKKKFTVDVKTALVEVKSSTCGNGSVTITTKQDKKYYLKINLKDKKSTEKKISKNVPEGVFASITKSE